MLSMASTLNQSLLLALWVWASAASLRSIDGLPMSARHELWMLQYGRVYKNQAEREHRFQIFKENVEYIDSANTRASDRKYFLGVNQFADITKEELKASRNGFNFKKAGHAAANATENFRYGNVSDVPSAMDWRAKGAVTPIKDQGQCGCCWAFSAVASTEGINQITTGKLVSLSEQEVVSCDVNGQDQGCDGGLADGAFQFIIDNGGLTTEANYPYKGTDGTCNTSISASSAASISGYEDVPTNSESSLLSAAANQPVSVAIDAGGSDFQFYSTGVFTGRCGTELDHAVTVVGYGAASDGTKYWVVKNSWGTEWGEKGYIRMQRDVGAAEGLCGIAMQASYPTA